MTTGIRVLVLAAVVVDADETSIFPRKMITVAVVVGDVLVIQCRMIYCASCRDSLAMMTHDVDVDVAADGSAVDVFVVFLLRCC